MKYSEEHIERLAPKASTFRSGKKLSGSNNWQSFASSTRGIWGAIRGSGKNPYKVQIDLQDLAYKCSCPSRQFPCKHSIALLLLHANDSESFATESEPPHVAEWLDKRKGRAAKVEQEEQELTEEEKQKRQTAKVKREASRHKMVSAGLAELQLWLKDLLRIGLLDLPAKENSFFEHMAARMVDAKAPGIASRIRAFAGIDFSQKEIWQHQAMAIIAELHLLIKAYQKLDSMSVDHVDAIKALVGWNFNKKDLQGSKATETLKDEWLVLGSTATETDDLIVHRHWLHGLESQRAAIIINFETQYSNSEPVSILDGSILAAELAFYPELSPHRAFVKKQREVKNQLSGLPTFCADWMDQHQRKVKLMRQSPWTNDRSFLMSAMHLVAQKGDWLLVDKAQNCKPVVRQYPIKKILTALLHSNRIAVDIAVVEKRDGVYPLGVFKNGKYLCL